MRIRQLLLLPLLLIAVSACHEGTATAAPAATSVRASIPVKGAASTGRGEPDFCALARQYGAANLTAIDADDESPEQVRQVLANLDALVAAAPPDIHDDLATADRFEHQTFDADGNATAGTGRPDPHLQGALRHVADYLDQKCGIRP